jgi:AAA domain, putative AbiEii toxin, Type IV TA system/AAA domain
LDKENRKIKLNSLEFSTPPFRKLGNLKIDFADRITLIAGHNGIGKSTILGLISNTFGLLEADVSKTYFEDGFSTSIERIVYIALDEADTDYADPVVAATVDGKIIRKRCSLTRRSAYKRARVVPRTLSEKDEIQSSMFDTAISIGQDAKIPLPTIYLGVKRLASIGEAEEKSVASKLLDMPVEDSQLMVKFVNSVILGVQLNANVTTQSIKGSKKTVQPGYAAHQALAVSMGQDSLGSIATALASFNRLKRELGSNYVGGLLIIDELDVGFHPHAIERMMQELKKQANHLNLQIVATTHSPRLIEAIHPQGDGNSLSPDSVVYLLDTAHPHLAVDQSLDAILGDMTLRHFSPAKVKTIKTTLCVYFEDNEALQFCEALIPRPMRVGIANKYGVHLKLIALGIGGSNLIKLPDQDSIFKDRVLLVDADTEIPQKIAYYGNTVKLPCANGAVFTDRSPENSILKFLRNAVEAKSSDDVSYRALLNFSVKNPSTDLVRNTLLADESGKSGKRESTKKWWQANWKTLEEWGVIREWAKCHATEVAIFIKNFEAAVATTAQRLK